MSELVEVGIGECQCPETPHLDGDTVWLRPKLGLAAGIVLQEPVADWLRLPKEVRPPQEFMRGELSERYLTLGIAEWNLVDEAGPIPVNPVSIRANLLDDYERSAVVADRADDLYSDVALGPLRKLESLLSQATSTNGSTSAARKSSPKRRKPSKRSSTSTTPTAVTATTTG